jgi:Protein of unknown function (DUF2723)
MPASRLVRWGYPLAGVALFALYLPTLARGVTFSDGPELVTAVVTLGVAHPTGYPLFILAGHAFCNLLALPLRDCVKIEIMNALCGAAAAVLTARAAREIARLSQRGGDGEFNAKAQGRGDAKKQELRDADADMGGLAAGLSLGVAPLVWDQVRIPEVYALHLLLAAGAALAWVRFEVTGRTRYVIGAALLMGLGLAHHVTMVYMLPAALLYLLARRPSFFVSWGFPLACVVGFAPLLSYGFLIWANAHTTGVAWGDVHGWDTLYAHVTGRQYQSLLHSLDRAGHLARLGQIVPFFDRQLLPVGMVLFCVGVHAAVRRAARPALFFGVYLLLNVAHGVHYGVGDYAVYWIPALHACAVFLGVGLATLLGWARGWRRVRHARALLLAGLGVVLVPVAAARACDAAREPVDGESYGAEVAEHLPPGAVFMTQGDSYLFTMWYENHVLGRGIDAATVDMANLRTPWFQRYVLLHAPVDCDPRSPEFALDPAAYARRCDTYRKRIDLHDKRSWVSFGLAGNRRSYAVPPSAAPVLRGAEPACAERRYHDEHAGKECRCWGYGQSEGPAEGRLEEDCVESAEEGGVVPRDPVEVYAQRILEDMLDERPVLERNVLTQWSAIGTNPRGWDGPAYQRVSGEYALLGRGRFNQIVWFDDLKGLDACGDDTFHPVPMRPYKAPRTHPIGQERRRPYRPNPRPTLLQGSWLSEAPSAANDDATRDFAAGAPVYMKLDWFEKLRWDGQRPDRRGEPIRHGVRVCVFDPEGRKVAAQATLSGTGEPVPLLARGATRQAGTYHVAACTVGEMGGAPPALAGERRCLWTLLEYDFSVR